MTSIPVSQISKISASMALPTIPSNSRKRKTPELSNFLCGDDGAQHIVVTVVENRANEVPEFLFFF